jgi:hypothetical protein
MHSAENVYSEAQYLLHDYGLIKLFSDSVSDKPYMYIYICTQIQNCSFDLNCHCTSWKKD